MVNWKKTLGTSIVSTGLVLSSFGPLAFAQTSNGSNLNSVQPTTQILEKYQGGPFDVGLVNDDLLLNSLIKQGVIDKNASAAVKQTALKNYIANRAKAASQMAGPKSVKEIRANLQTKAGLKHKPPGKTKGQDSTTPKTNPGNGNGDVNPIQKETWNGPVRQDKELVILIDFPDYPYTDLPTRDGKDPGTVLSLPSYPTDHYKNMLFGKNGYTGPSGQNLISEKQFYEQQSGGSYTVDGDVYGWFTADHPAAYYGGHNAAGGNDSKPRDLINEALAKVAASGVNLSQYDIEDPYDLDGDGDLREPDGIIDHLVVVHSGIGEESGGGSLGQDAIWSHSSNLAGPTVIPGTSGQAKVKYWGGSLVGYGYVVQPEDGAAGVFSHEFGHNLGLPDDYDIAYSTPYDEPVGYWSIMSAGSWAGKIAGTEPTGFNAKDKEFLQSTMPGSNWFKPVTYDLSDLTGKGQFVKLDEASVKGTNADAVRVNLPDKVTQVNTPASGSYEYFSGSDNNLDNSMTTTVDLTGETSAELTFKTWYDIEQDWDYASVKVQQGSDWVTVPGNITTTTNPNDQNPGNGITGSSNGKWVDAKFDLSQFAGQKINLRFNYWTDVAAIHPGFYVDDVSVTADGATILSDGAENSTSPFTLNGFKKDQGTVSTTNYYLLEWRNYAAADKALADISRGHSLLAYDPGLVIWYVDNKYTDNVEADHPGHGFLNVVDAHQNVASWTDGTIASNRYQIKDAAFSLNKTGNVFLDYHDITNRNLVEAGQAPVPAFNDAKAYYNPSYSYIGVQLPQIGLKVNVVGQAKDMSVGSIHLQK
ncbi:immune inhibitor A domain-containing protein [Neobacillus cucumis]|uniref:immune inhibitor A domain-containing protein n=1 Tax=Neobacillus cucumis TaxID=1740721 RepID=UPI002E1A626B|nr:immune inhibitor A domain-containing protein [Neobacillus cucumis]MED4227864.1 immune inhibitor A [Neobacillus cucumis]